MDNYLERISYSALVIAVLLLGILPSYLAPTARASPTSSTVVSVFSSTYGSSNITDTGLVTGSQFTIDINVDNAPSFNGYEFALFFDPSFLQALSTDARTATVFNNPIVFTSEICAVGAVGMFVTNSGSLFAGGSGTLAHITFKVLAAGVSPLVLAAGTSDPSNIGASSGCGDTNWTRLVSAGNVLIDVRTSDGYFSNVPSKLGPVASFTFMPSAPVKGDSVAFNATKSFDPDSSAGNGIKAFTWDFGDGSGTTSAGPLAHHIFKPQSGTPYVGNFSVRLTVIDVDDGFEGMVTQLVTVIQPPPLCRLGLQMIQVPRDCPTIKSALDSVVLGGTVKVDPGLYQEDFSILKTVNVIGAGSGVSIVNGSISISAPRVKFAGFTVLNGRNFPGTALSLYVADWSIISNNTITGPTRPPFLENSRFQSDTGIILANSIGVTISNNTITDEIYGFTISRSPDSTLHGNTMADNLFSFGVGGLGLGDFVENIDTSNTIDGKPIYYFQNTKNPNVPLNAGFIGLVNVQDLDLEGRSVSGVNQGILLVGSKNVTIIGFNAARVREGISVSYSSDVVIKNFVATGTINGGEINNSSSIVIEQSSLGDSSCAGFGISIFGSMRIQILNNSILCGQGLTIDSSNSNEISHNFFSSPPIGSFSFNEGLDVSRSTANEFRGNHFSNYRDLGILLDRSPTNLFEGNVLEDSPVVLFGGGISLINSPRNIFRDNAIAPHTGFSVRSLYLDCVFGKIPCRLLDDYIQYVDTTNTIGGKPIYYLINYNSYTVPSNAGFVAVVNSTNVSIPNANLSFNDQDIVIVSSMNVRVENANLTLTSNGIFAWRSTGLTIEHTTISSMLDFGMGISLEASNQGLVVGNTIDSRLASSGVNLFNSTDFMIQGNYIANYQDQGISLIHSSNNTLYRNSLLGFRHFQNPYMAGISLGYRSRGNLIVGNTVAENLVGLAVDPGNTIYFNNLLNNFEQIAGSITQNTWDNGAGQGNYWSDYKGVDTNADGVGDTLLPQAGVDNYPLTSPWSPQGLTADLAGRAAWPEHQNFIATKDNDALQTLFTKVTNTGPSSEWVEGVFNITSTDGSIVRMISGPVWLEPGTTIILPVMFRPSSGTYHIAVQLKFSSDAFISWTIAGTKSFSFKATG